MLTIPLLKPKPHIRPPSASITFPTPAFPKAFISLISAVYPPPENTTPQPESRNRQQTHLSPSSSPVSTSNPTLNLLPPIFYQLPSPRPLFTLHHAPRPKGAQRVSAANQSILNAKKPTQPFIISASHCPVHPPKLVSPSKLQRRMDQQFKSNSESFTANLLPASVTPSPLHTPSRPTTKASPTGERSKSINSKRQKTNSALHHQCQSVSVSGSNPAPEFLPYSFQKSVILTLHQRLISG